MRVVKSVCYFAVIGEFTSIIQSSSDIFIIARYLHV